MSVNKGRNIFVLVSLFAEESPLVMKREKLYFFNRKKIFDPETICYDSRNLQQTKFKSG